MSTVYYSMSTVSQHTRWIPEPSPPCGCFDTDRDRRPVDGHSSAMEACGCGEDQIPWMLAKFGLLGTASLVLGGLAVMILAGWALGTVVWLLRRREPNGSGTAPVGAPVGAAPDEADGFAGFTWRTADEPGAQPKRPAT
ncbi:hypothetical protein [Streptomyces sp. NBC_01236]|uniref:hypothetical protein n=1 Tax=Streptomyces sp. NBC_01236 TaxID=2903789 RepID=UPI002E107106|nr:hypothetical protein OG324_30930 [Streptomyces sp. NBC_01236]